MLEQCKKDLKILELEYLDNKNIASNGSCMAWCFWNGTIGCDHFDMGKWESAKNIYDEWTLIAKTWQFLSLTAQIFKVDEDGDNYNNDYNIQNKILAEFIVENGSVKVREPIEKILKYYSIDRFTFKMYY